MKVCKRCGEEKALCGAHIIPLAFYKSIRGENGDLDLYSASAPGRRQRRPRGERDSEILCKDCDHQLGVNDQYGAETLIHQKAKIQESHSNGSVCFRRQGIDSVKFKRFLVSVLWRASISNEPMWSQVQLASNEKLAELIAFGERNPTPKDFPFIGYKFLQHPFNKVAMNPMSDRIDGMRFVTLMLPGYAFHVKTCSAPVPRLLAEIQPDRYDALLLTGRDPRSTSIVENARNFMLDFKA